MKGVGNLQKMLKQAKEMQEKIKKELDERTEIKTLFLLRLIRKLSIKMM